MLQVYKSIGLARSIAKVRSRHVSPHSVYKSIGLARSIAKVRSSSGMRPTLTRVSSLCVQRIHNCHCDIVMLVNANLTRHDVGVHVDGCVFMGVCLCVCVHVCVCSCVCV